MRIHILSVLCLGLVIGAHTALSAQTITAETSQWCADATTVCWSDTDTWGPKGLRFIFEPQLGAIFQAGDNKFENTNLESLEKLGVATSLYGKQLGLQLLLIYPSAVSFDEQSPVRVAGQLLDTENFEVDVEWGYTLGLTFLDGVISAGWGKLAYDRRDFLDPDALEDTVFSDGFWYINFQAIEAVKNVIKN